MSMFTQATKRAVRARIALDGPAGSGKTFTALSMAAVLGGPVALIDTEHGSASLYADLFDFSVLEVSAPYHPQRIIDAIRDAEANGFRSLIVDSLSHFWDGEGGVIDIADAAGARAGGNSWAGWKTGTPVLRHLIDTFLATPLHVIVTMRSKQEWVLEESTNSQGRRTQTPKRVGMAPVMRNGMEFEFTVVGDLNLDHQLTISKSRCPDLADRVIQPGRAGEAADLFVAWMNRGAAVAAQDTVDRLKARINAIADAEVRKQCKQAFVHAFGNPDNLLADKVGEAEALIAGFEPTVDPPPTGDRSQTVAGPTGGERFDTSGIPVGPALGEGDTPLDRIVANGGPEPVHTPDAAGLPGATDDVALPAPKVQRTQATALEEGRKAAQLDARDFRNVVLVATGLRTEDPAHLTIDEYTRAADWLNAIAGDPAQRDEMEKRLASMYSAYDDNQGSLLAEAGAA